MNSRTVFRAAIAIATGSLAFSAAATSQNFNGRVVFTPYAGVFAQAGYLGAVDQASGPFGGGKVRSEPAAGVGATLSYWINDRAALELSGGYAFSGLQYKLNGSSSWKRGLGPDLSSNAYTLLGSARFMYTVTPSEYGVRVRLGVGPAIVSRGGKAFDLSEGKITGLTDVGGVMSLCTRIPLTERIAIRLRAEDYVYQARLRYEGPESTIDGGKRVQNDLMFSTGLQIAFNRK